MGKNFIYNGVWPKTERKNFSIRTISHLSYFLLDTRNCTPSDLKYWSPYWLCKQHLRCGWCSIPIIMKLLYTAGNTGKSWKNQFCVWYVQRVGKFLLESSVSLLMFCRYIFKDFLDFSLIKVCLSVKVEGLSQIKRVLEPIGVPVTGSPLLVTSKKTTSVSRNMLFKAIGLCGKINGITEINWFKECEKLNPLAYFWTC